MIDRIEIIRRARKALFDAGGITFVTDGKTGWMSADAPEFEERAATYNALAEFHAKLSENPCLPKAYRDTVEQHG
jgi:hypothetical protein